MGGKTQVKRSRKTGDGSPKCRSLSSVLPEREAVEGKRIEGSLSEFKCSVAVGSVHLIEVAKKK